MSPALFIIAIDYLSRSIANLFENQPNMNFRTRGGFLISHLCFADDLIIFMNASRNHIKKLMDFLSYFQSISGLSLNNKKCFFYVHNNMKSDRILPIKEQTGFMHGVLPIKYLGTPLYKGRKRSFLFDDLITFIQNKLHSWDSNFLSFGGRLTLIRSVLSSFPVYSFQTLLPTKLVCKRIDIILNKFFWKGFGGNNKIIWASWDKCCGVRAERGLGCKTMADLTHAFSYKLWFNFRANKSLWAKFMFSKYCFGKHHFLCVLKNGDSKVSRRMCKIKWDVEPHLSWGIGGDNIFFWQDQLLNSSSIDSFINSTSKSVEKVSNFITDNCWNYDKLADILPDCIIQKIINLPTIFDSKDMLLCKLSKDGLFSLKEAWHSFRLKKEVYFIYSKIWHKTIQSTISIFIWRLFHKIIPTDDILRKRGIIKPSKCQCCFHSENMHHVFVFGPIAVKTWIYFEDVFKLNIYKTNMSIYGLLNSWFVNPIGHIRNVTYSLIFLVLVAGKEQLFVQWD
ncbi:Putative ribonuclease H protein [Dendrobium catenatum]|uniref:Ribonuclease H protein n=1 Tax=Dendrobium catenatum TaxID=906689 RepID=A0A2I0VUZ6_9ASPA|nr:Putative ribonuclease H protein [Dendrobium catenatum]